MLTLTITHRRELKAQAHALNPVVMIGKTGLSPSVIAELDRGLLSHELIKIKAQIDDRTARNALFEEICQQLGAAPVQHIGKIFIIYRPKPEETEKKSVHTIHRKKREAFRAKRSFQN
ncbi:MAG: YhbY family RNA-binding protein [Nitrosomonas sp.]|jgi:RNA-binding protein|uniref:YhbY family RNA-binding protein n=1 Tax=Nitrosomonas sp. TaxID=42353 RepID=UPI0025E007E1|nr:YhbY family RNA-binding protein [Nitrosomonas sp.]MBK6957516.1 YhbY family RNA-binding protein [Nitrosomonas sp.]MBY0484391.1 YhbY family RNA-binding protein [Nitrosomonas sp.]MDO8893394.1 YhbY family RNA-binding protein [Nitrosomonas sp.]MDO9469403.1 YhbY family RNA-binding protein [Nitrosomonas sp.]MDP1788400.1 YhbY family RNA-binding protein [Nitrosomonas sp.]